MKGSSSKVRLLDLAALDGAAECLKTLAHPHRLRMVQMLLQDEFTVGALAEACEIPSHMASEHLRLMRDRGLLDFERRGRCIYYHIVETGLQGLMSCIEGRFGGERPPA
jgi:DNA-binding transcriptional ArsR family regulator